MTAPLDRLRPVIRTSAELAPTTQPDVIVRRPVGMLLVEAIRLNDAYDPRLVTHSDLEQWGIDADAAFAAARENLADEHRAFLMESLERGMVVRNLAPEGNATTWAVTAPFIRSMMPPHPSRPGADDPLVYLPEPETMFISRSSNAEESAAALAMTRTVFTDSEHPLAPCAFRYGPDDQLEPWVPAPELGEELVRNAAASRAEFICHVYGQMCDRYAETPEARRLVKQNRWQLNPPSVTDSVVPLVELKQATWQAAKQVMAPVYAHVRFVPNKATAVDVALADVVRATPELVAGVILDPAWVILANFPTPEQFEKLLG